MIQRHLRKLAVNRLISLLFVLAATFSCESFAPSPAFLLPTTTHPSRPTSLQASQLLEFEEPTTGVRVKLVGTMHYNPTSIQLATETIESLARVGKLGSVVIESCDIRWNQTNEMDPFFQKILNSEMKAACNLALEYGRPVVLGDQRINETVSYMGAAFKETLSHLFNPVEGWTKFVVNLKMARQRALPFGDDAYLNFNAILDPKLLAAAPVSLAKYPLSYLVKSPFFTIGLFLFLFLADQQTGSVPTDQMTAIDWAGSLGFAALETAVFARVFLKELLADRNEILARNILEQCKLYQPKKNWWDKLACIMPNKKDAAVMYVYGSNVNIVNDGNEKEIVAVVGLAHSNGIMKLLKEQRL